MKLRKQAGLDEAGAVSVVVALTFTALCGFAAIAVDLGHYLLVKAELQRTTDAAALAGATGLLPYANVGQMNQTTPTPNWTQGQQQAHTIISNPANLADNQQFSLTDGTVSYGYWVLNPTDGYVQLPLPTSPSITPGAISEPAIIVTLTRNVTFYLAPIIGVANSQSISATSVAILPTAVGNKNFPPVAVSWDTVYDMVGNSIQIDVADVTLKPQSNKGIAGWFNLDGGNGVPSCRISSTMIANSSQIYTVPGTKASLTNYITQGQTIVVPIVQQVLNQGWETIMGYAAFKVDLVNANSMTGHFLNKYFDPNVNPIAGDIGIPGGVAGTPRLVGQ